MNFRALLPIFALASLSQGHLLSQSSPQSPIPLSPIEAETPAHPVVSLPPDRTSIQVSTGSFGYVMAEPIPSPIVKNAPFVAQAETRSTQTLSDGNHIVHSSSAQIFRDSAGRTRREQSFASIGQWNAEEAMLQLVFIQDPVENKSYVLNPNKHTASRSSLALLDTKASKERRRSPGRYAADTMLQLQRHIRLRAGAAPPSAPALATVPPLTPTNSSAISTSLSSGANPAAGFTLPSKRQKPAVGILESEPQMPVEEHGILKSLGMQTESLGQKTIAGVVAEGTRTTTTIPADTIGNEKPIQIISEKWISKELQIVLLYDRKDPRTGETTYQVTSLERSEPEKVHFQVPPDYLIEDGLPLGAPPPGAESQHGHL